MKIQNTLKLGLSLFVVLSVSCDKSLQNKDEQPHYFVECWLGEVGQEEFPFTKVEDKALSTFSIDVDTASYTYARAQINEGRTPEISRLRTEEFVNYFKYESTEPVEFNNNLSVSYEVGDAPWEPSHRLLKAIIKAKEVKPSQVSPLNLVFLIDVSGSMDGEGRLGLVKESLNFLIDHLRPEDRISIVTYGDKVSVLLQGADGGQKNQIRDIVNGLTAAGSTAGHAGIQTAYEIAHKFFSDKGISRVILSTDGDFNVGITDTKQLTEYVAHWARSNIFLTVHGYGMGNFNDEMLEKISNEGNGNYAYIDSSAEAKKTFQMQIIKTVSLVAKDVKVQVNFQGSEVLAYRLIGYENRRLIDSDFENDSKDAGDMGAGHTVVALYELILKQDKAESLHPKIGALNLRYKNFPREDVSHLYITEMSDSKKNIPSADFCFFCFVAGFALKIA
ncbi:MAG: von Willebrand factor type A domain-containing protein [Bdellovibrionales bacterium]|nr:von Willebrand factor type A domain-containing protein [Bdellovibrionales bacterium]